MKMTLAAMLLATLMAGPEPQPVRTVLFVCEHGSAKSVVAAAHFNRIAAERGLPFHALSRGTVPDPAMAPAAVQGLLADGLKPAGPAPTRLTQSDLDTAARVVSFCDLPPDLKPATPVERWEVPPVSTEYARSRDAMLARMEPLLLELNANSQTQTPAPGLDTALIERLTGAKGALDAASGVFKVSVPRSDLDVRVGGVRLSPRLGLTSWAAFQKAENGAMVMGDLVLLEPQVNPVMSVALDNGLEVTALHNHFFGDEPKVMFMHIGGHGSVQDLAAAVGRVFRAAGEKPPAVPQIEIDPARTSLDAEKVEAALGAKGEMKDGVLRFTFGKTTRMHGETAGAAMGVNTWAAFAGSDSQAMVDGDFAMEERELQPVLKALRKAGISVVAIHNHMTGEEPRIVFLHYWGVGPAARLAQGLRSALEAQALPAPPLRGERRG